MVSNYSLKTVCSARPVQTSHGKARNKNKVIDGNKIKSTTRTKSLAKKGKTPAKVLEIGISPAILLMMNTFKPTGGVINPTSTTIRVRIPNQMTVSSCDIPKSRLIMTGKKTGIVKSIIARLSIRQPRTR